MAWPEEKRTAALTHTECLIWSIWISIGNTEWYIFDMCRFSEAPQTLSLNVERESKANGTALVFRDLNRNFHLMNGWPYHMTVKAQCGETWKYYEISYCLYVYIRAIEKRFFLPALFGLPSSIRIKVTMHLTVACPDFPFTCHREHRHTDRLCKPSRA